MNMFGRNVFKWQRNILYIYQGTEALTLVFQLYNKFNFTWVIFYESNVYFGEYGAKESVFTFSLPITINRLWGLPLVSERGGAMTKHTYQTVSGARQVVYLLFFLTIQ